MDELPATVGVKEMRQMSTKIEKNAMKKVSQINSPRKPSSFAMISFGSSEKLVGRKSSSETIAGANIDDYYSVKTIWAAKACQAGFRGYMARKKVRMMVDQKNTVTENPAGRATFTPLRPTKIVPSQGSPSPGSGSPGKTKPRRRSSSRKGPSSFLDAAAQQRQSPKY